ncbi:hypothetical protein [Bdellovibrio sp. BCCA]|uniref:hypothetical protein n=1 Tax=Bdellovibrio sp. BCCA TaxID=3136281 RepID=UPI0030F1D58D
MARRTLVVLFLVLLGAVFALVLSNKGETPEFHAVSENQEEAQSSKTPAPENSPAATTQVTEVASSEQPQGMPAREKIRDLKSIRGAKTINTKNANLEEVGLFADSRWKLWNGVSAVSKSAGRKPQGNILGEVNGYYLVEEEAAVNDFKNFSSAHPLVVMDSRLDEVGVVTGVFTVTLKEGVSPDILTQASGLKVLNSFPNIRTYFVTSSQEPFDLQSFQDALKGEASVEEVKMEVLSRQYEKN